MSCKVEACAECTQRCMHLHRKTKKISTVASFFKIMLGDMLTKVLYLPPMFAATVPTMSNKKVVLEDSLGKQWQVTVSTHEGALAFEEGWNVFSLEHGLEVGDVVIFNHIMDFHFHVRIYTKTGCEKLEFSRNGNPKKRTSAALETVGEGFINPQTSSTSVGYGSNVAVSQDKCGAARSRNTNVTKEKRPNNRSNGERLRPHLKMENFDDSYDFILQNRDVRPEENRSALVDLFSMEMQIDNTRSKENATNKTDGVIPTRASTSLSTAIAAEPIRIVVVKDENTEILPLNMCNSEAIEKGLCLEAVDAKTSVSGKTSCHDKTMGVPFITSAVNSDKNMEYFCDTPLKEVRECQNIRAICNTPSTITRDGLTEAVPLEKHSFPTGYLPSAEHEYTPSSLGVQKLLSGEVRKKIKEEPLETPREVESPEELIKEIWEPKEIIEELIENKDVHKLVNTGNGNSVGDAHLFCLVAKDTPSFLVLPTFLPTGLPSSRKGKKHTEKKKVVYLRDPRKRVWPVFYHEMPEIQVLTSGWKAFSSANQIEPGDECWFRVEDELERIYEVSIKKV